MRLYNAICGWLEAHAASMGVESEPQPDAHSYSAPPELHAASDRQSIDDDQGGVYHVRPIGFRRNGSC